ncbi:MAG TPA: SRPBCC family protein [Burkholderiales bacterium]|nr:SRPBCC family protein [Burkholderiales bacterium]
MRALIPGTAACLLAFLAVGGARGADDISVETTRRGEAMEVICKATLEAPPELIWRTLTDYGHLAEFIPGMRRSRVIEQRGAVSVVEQSGVATFLFFSTPIEVTLASTERPPNAIEVSMIKGNLKRLDGAYRIEPQQGGRMLLTWNGIVEAQSLPPLLGELVMRANIADQFRGMVREIERRDALRRDKQREAKP